MNRSDFRSGLCIDSAANGGMYVACLIAQAFTRGEPSIDTMMRRFGMSRATAFRWRKAWRTATGAQDVTQPRAGTRTTGATA